MQLNLRYYVFGLVKSSQVGTIEIVWEIGLTIFQKEADLVYI